MRGLGTGLGLSSSGSGVASTPSVPVNTIAPVASGTATVGSILSVTTGGWTDTPTGYAYQWKRAGSNIGGATSNIYTLVTADGGQSITCSVTASNAGGSGSPGTSNAIVVAAELPQQGSIVGRWRTDTITPVVDGAAIASWVDSINGQTISGSSGQQPLYKVNRYGGQPALLFDGVDDRLTGTCTQVQAALTSGEFTVMVAYGRTATTAFGFMFSATNSTGFNLMNNGTNAGELFGAANYPYSGVGFSTAMRTNTQSYPSTSSGGLGNDPRGQIWVNGSVIGQSGSASVTPTSIGIGASATGVGPYKGEIQEIIVWSTRLSFAEGIQAERAIRDYYQQAYPWTAAGYYYVGLGDSIHAGYLLSATNKQWPGSLAMNSLGLSMGGWSNLGYVGASAALAQRIATKESLSTLSATTGVPTKYSYFEFYNLRTSATSPIGSSSAVTTTQALLTQLKSVAGDKVAFGTTLDYAGRGAEKSRWTGYWDTPANRTGYMDLYVPLHSNVNIGADGCCANSAPYSIYWANESGSATGNVTTSNGSSQMNINTISVGTFAVGQTLLSATLGVAVGTTILSFASGSGGAGSVANLSASAGAGAGTGSMHVSGGDGVHPGDGGMATHAE